METPPPPGPQGQPPQGQFPPPGGPQGPYGTVPGQAPGPYAGQGQGPHPGPPPGPYGYRPWGNGYSPYTSPAPVNGLAIAALVLGILCFLPLVGLVLGVVALAQIRKRGERGKGMAVAGAVLSGAGAILLVAGLVGGVAGDFWEGVKEGARGAGGNGVTFSVHEGECFDVPGGSLEGMAYDVDTVSCEGEHDGEVFANFTLPEGRYPGDDGITDAADERCHTLQYEYAMDTWAVPENVDIYYFTPTRESWGLGDREISCLFGNMDEKGGLTGSLRQDGTTLGPDPFAYLQAAHVLNEAMESAPEEAYVEDDLPGHRKWATRMSEGIAEQVGMLRGHTWPADAKAPVAALVEDLEKARKEWAKAARSEDADAYYEHYELAMDLIDGKNTVPAREALGLETTPPVQEEDADGGGGAGDGPGAGAEV
ncbi:DUF4190 domain-containing protein [Streptomyces fructofermentans]|uniref:Membrane protein n=1 Tax=Streptomyces fructofermentans TaxID=152141 RepID=A0A918K006_9ACTN|nr:DUF4190 domain-containing protein [Streptomyces fructofermentans]GGX40094.1 membrane protein [Streptomyces fructofermentans]